MTSVIYTRQDYMSNRCDFDAYYGQYVTAHLIAYVVSMIGEDDIMASVEESMNDIPLKRWDGLMPGIRSMIPRGMLKDAGEIWSLSTSCCIAKTAASIYRRSRASK